MAPTFGGSAEKCHVCAKTVYATEKIVVEDKEDKRTYHKACLKCTHCAKTLSLGNYASMSGVMYCKPHFKQLFATKGNYDEGFGKDKLTKKWAPAAGTVVGMAAPGGASFVPVESTTTISPSTEKKETPSGIASRFKSSPGQDKCTQCAKTVYATERIVVEDKEDKKVFHKACLRCSHCSVVLTLGNYAGLQGKFFCKPHFKQLFASKGNYDEGFGGKKHSAKWLAEADGATSTSPTSTPPPEREIEHTTTSHTVSSHHDEPEPEVVAIHHKEEKEPEEEPVHSHHHDDDEHEDEHHHHDHHDHDHDHDHDHEHEHNEEHDHDHHHHHHDEVEEILAEEVAVA